MNVTKVTAGQEMTLKVTYTQQETNFMHD